MKTKNDYLDHRAKELKALNEKFNAETEFRSSKYLYLEENREAFESCLKRLHLLTPSWSDLNITISSDGLQAHVSMVVTADEKFRFLKDLGYNAKGESKNKKQRENKARKIREAFEMVGFSVNANPFSLEYMEENDTVLLSWNI